MQALSRLFVAACLTGALASAHAQTPAAATRIRASVMSLQGDVLKVRDQKGGPMDVQLLPTTRITVESRSSLAALKPGQFVGTTSEPQADGTLLALQIRIFPEALRGTGEGHRTMNAAGGNTMTNATVRSIGATPAHNTMTNATVTTLAQAGEHTSMLLAFKDGEKRIVVPPHVTVVQSELADRSVLVPGAHLVLSLSQKPDGGYSIERITVGKNGSQPM